MSEEGSSPFVEDPYGDDVDSVFSLRQKISQLQFQVDTLETERELEKKDQELLKNKYERLIHKKNEEFEELQKNFDYLFKQREELKSKISNSEDIYKVNIEQLKRQLENEQKRTNQVLAKSSDLEEDLSQVTRENKKLMSSLDYEKSIRGQLEERITSLESKNTDLYEANGSLLEKFDKLYKDLTSSSSEKYSKNLKETNDLLAAENSKLSQKVDGLLQQKISGEVWKQKALSLTTKVKEYQDVEEKSCRLEIELMKMRNKFDSFYSIIGEYLGKDTVAASDGEILDFLDSYKSLRNKILVSQDKLNQKTTENRALLSEVTRLKTECESLTLEADYSTKLLKEKEDFIDNLNRQKKLNQKEIEFLRKKLNDTQIKQVDSNSEKTSTDQYLTNLEKLVEEYKNEIVDLQNQLSSFKPGAASVGSKRPRLVDDGMINDNRANLRKLENENNNLRLNIKDLNDEKEALKAQLDNMTLVSNKEQQLHILQLKSNPASKDQLIKQNTLDCLKKENEDLLKTLSVKEGIQDLIPRSVFERQENDLYLLQEEIRALRKQNNRLKEIYAQKSKEILTVISKFFGYTIEFLPSTINPNDLSRMKLVSKYMESKSSLQAFLILDLKTKSLKANGDIKFKSLCETLVANWVNDKNQIPCFLSSLTLSIYDDYANSIRS